MESWRQYLNESPDKTYYWQTRGPWKSESQIEFGVTHVPKARPRPQTRIEQIFEEVRKNQFPSRPSRLNCVYLCENLKGWEGKSFCSYPPHSDGETYEVKLRGNYNLFKTNSEYWTEAEVAYTRNKREDDVERWAKSYWGGGGMPTFTEILVSPPESAIIIRKYGKPEEEDTDIDNDGDTDIEDVLAVTQAAATQGTTEGGKWSKFYPRQKVDIYF